MFCLRLRLPYQTNSGAIDGLCQQRICRECRDRFWSDSLRDSERRDSKSLLRASADRPVGSCGGNATGSKWPWVKRNVPGHANAMRNSMKLHEIPDEHQHKTIHMANPLSQHFLHPNTSVDHQRRAGSAWCHHLAK